MNASDNLRGIALMVLGMLGLAFTDAFLKALGGAIPAGQIMMVQGLGCGTVFGVLALRQGATGWRGNFLRPVVLVRNVFEVLATGFFLVALELVPLSIISTILQANPLIVTLGAAVWLREAVGPRRWAAVIVGLLGVVIVLRPWSATFDANVLFALAATVGLSLRDLVTRRVPARISTLQVATFAFGFLIVAGAASLLLQGQRPVIPNPTQALLLCGAVCLLCVGYFGITSAMRVGEVGVVMPFRYVRIVFALIIAALVFGERPDLLTYVGAGVIVASGLYTLWREQIRRKA